MKVNLNIEEDDMFRQHVKEAMSKAIAAKIRA